MNQSIENQYTPVMDHRFVKFNTSIVNTYVSDEHIHSRLYDYARHHSYVGIIIINPNIIINFTVLSHWIHNLTLSNNRFILQNKSGADADMIYVPFGTYNDPASTYNTNNDVFVETILPLYRNIVYKNIKTPIVIFAHKRDKSLRNLLDSIKIADPNRLTYISEDSDHTPMVQVAIDYNATLIQQRYTRSPDNYQNLATHFKLTLAQLFEIHEALIILEEDLLVSVDFFHYMDYFEPFLATDPTLMCISAWNDNGFTGKVNDPTRVYRTHFFPGLGWLINKNIWTSIHDKWKIYWDDNIRNYEYKHDGRQCIYPEISRTYHTFSEIGTSNGSYRDKISLIHINTVPIMWGYTHNYTKLNYNEYIQWYRAQMSASNVIKVTDGTQIMEDNNLMSIYGGRYRSSFIFPDKSIVVPMWDQEKYVYILIDSAGL
jgi:hypothetical protein